MRNPLSKTRTFEAALALVAGDDGALEFAVGAVELGLVGQDPLVEGAESHDVGLESPVVGGFDGIEEGGVSGGGSLEGLVDPVRQWLCRVSCILGGGIDLAYVREVVRAVFGGIPRHSTVIELLDPFGRVRESSADRDSKRWETAVFDIAGRGLREGVDISDKTGLEEFDRLFMVIQLLFVVRFFADEVLVVAVGAGLGGDDESVDDGSVGVGGEVVAGDGGADGSRGHLSEGEKVVFGGGGSCGYWSVGSGSKESRYSGMCGEDAWLRRGEFFKIRIDESRGSGAIVAVGVGCDGFEARVMRHGLVAVMKGAIGEFTIPAMY